MPDPQPSGSVQPLALAGDVPVHGTLAARFRPVARTFQRQLARTQGGAALCIYHKGRCVADLWGGARNRGGDPWVRNTMSPSFSTTKGVASTLVHMTVDRGALDYESRVSDYWPRFGQAGKRDITVRHVLAHQSGLYHIRQMIDRADRMLDWDFMIDAIERAEPIHPPGERTGYHGLTYGFLVGELLQRVTGRPFRELVQEELAVPLRLDGLYVGAPEGELVRAAELMGRVPATAGRPRRAWIDHRVNDGIAYLARGMPVLRLPGLQIDFGSMLDALAPRGIGSFDFGAPQTLRAAIPAANGLFTARSLARMYAALAGGGQIDGVRILSPQTLARATEPQLEAPGRAVMPLDLRWRLGYHAVFTSRGVPRRAFGHFGFGGSGAFADPSRELAVGLIVNSGLGTPFGDGRIVRIGGAALACADAGRDRSCALERAARGVFSLVRA